MRLIRTCLIALLALSPAGLLAEPFLLMAEEDGCQWCERWDEEIAHIYPKTVEGRTAPLQRYDLHDGTPAGVALNGPVRFTPTFILVVDGVEKGRIEGYPGEDFFWPLLAALLQQAQAGTETAG